MNAALAAVAALAAAALVLAGCGVGGPGDEGEVSETADTYLRALADADFARACAQLTPAVTAALGDCRDDLERVAARVGTDQLERAADRGLAIQVDGGEASAAVRHLGARLKLARVAEEWRIAEGYELR